VEVKGSGFPLPASPMESLGLYLLEPGTADLSMGVLNPASVQRDGTFSEWAPLWKRGCEAAALDGKAEQPTGNLFIAARSGETPVGPGERIPNIIAVARYAYTTTTPHVPTESLSVSPESGPCDAMVDVRGEGFEPGTEIPLDLARPNSDDVMGRLAVATADSDGKFSARVSLGHLGCEAAALYDRFASPGSPREIEIYAGFRQDVLFVAARARYTYTTTQPAPPQPTLVLTPASGPCDARVEVTGQDFPPSETIELGVGQIGGQAVEGRLDAVRSDADGQLSFSTLLGFLGCGMAGVTKERTGGDQLWLLGYVLEPGPSAGPTARILARAPYTFTTTESTLPIAVLTLSPSSGPCDATVQATGTLFEPGSDVTLRVARPDSEGYMGTLGQVRADTNGGFVTRFSLGALGCEAAALHARVTGPGEPNEFPVCGAAYQASRCAVYTSTTTAVSPEPHALPSTGSGPGGRSMSPVWLALAAALASVGLTLVVASLYQRRQRS
jgi:hypothetical protein